MNFLHWFTKACTLCCVVLSLATSAEAQLRIADYNTTGGPRTGLSTVLAAIGEEIVNGFAKPIDVLILQEQSSSATTTQAIVDLLNGLYGPGTYARATVDAATSGAGRPGLIYNVTTVQLIDQIVFGTVSTSAQARQTARYQLRPIGYDEAADFFVYSNHYKASSSDSDEDRRAVEASALRANLDAIGEGTRAILAGDYNMRSSSEAAYQVLLSPGAGQAFDPANRPGTWHDNASFRFLHTQAPAVNPSSGLIGGGMDDRFDFQLVTGEFLDGEGLDFIPNSYRTFGNNGTHDLNGNISTGTGASPAVLSALMTASDHLPVVADYQLPAVLDVVTATIPATLDVGQAFQLEVFVRNAADVLVPIGADELDYSLTASGNLLGDFEGIDEALGASNSHLITFDTSSMGLKSGTITVSSSSQGVAGGLVQIPVSFEVLAAMLEGDFNGDGTVDAADYVTWRNDDQTIDGYTQWRANFGNMSGKGAALIAANRLSAVVPEPPISVLLVLIAAFFSHSRNQFIACRFRKLGPSQLLVTADGLKSMKFV